MSSFSRLNSLDKSRADWRIKARVTRMWPTVSVDNGTTRGQNLILLDDDNTHVHAFAYADTWNVIGQNVNEGGVYVFRDFAVKDAIGLLKPVCSMHTIRFNNGSNIQPVEDNAMIPLQKFEFLDLGDLYSQAAMYEPNENPEFAADVIGAVEEFEKLKLIPTKYGNKEIVRFRLCDSTVRHRVAIWGELAKAVNNDFIPDNEKPVIAILTSTKLNTYKNSVQISTLPSSKVYFNLEDDYVTEYRQRLEEEGYKSRDIGDGHTETYAIPFFEKVSIKQLMENPTDFVKMNMFCTFVIAKVEDDCFWWYHSCNKCQCEVSKIDKSYKCFQCPRSIPVAEKRFRLKVIAEDYTSSCTVILMDRVVKQLIHSSATNLKKATDTDPKMVPDVLTGLAGKQLTTVIDVAEETNNSGVFVFNATDMYEEQASASASIDISSPPQIPIISISDSLDLPESSTTPGSAMSVSKKIKLEK